MGYTKAPATVEFKLHQINEITAIILFSNDVPSHLFSIIAAEICKISHNKMLLVSTAAQDYQRSTRAFTQIGTSACQKQMLLTDASLVTGICAKLMEKVCIS